MKKITGISILIFSVILLPSCKKETIADLTTTEILYISPTTAISGGYINNGGGSSVSSRGVCWNTHINPTVANNKTTDGTGTGTFVSSITRLIPSTAYYLRSYAINSVGISYGNEITFFTPDASVTDIDTNFYAAVNIGNQYWMKENLKTTRYRNGDLIGTTSPAAFDMAGESTPKYQWPYNGNEDNVVLYGRLYTWHAVTDNRNICPTGWHLPTDTEWITLTDHLTNNGNGFGGSGSDIAKSMAAPYGWDYSYTPGTIGNDPISNNASGFSALPGGDRDYSGGFHGIGNTAYWWISTEYDKNDAWYRNIDSGNGSSEVNMNYVSKHYAFSVRCVKDDK